MDFFCFFLHCPTQLFARGREIVCLYGCRLAYTINVVLEMSVFCRSALHWCYHDNWIHVNEHLRITVDFHFITDRYYAYFLLLSVRRHYKYDTGRDIHCWYANRGFTTYPNAKPAADRPKFNLQDADTFHVLKLRKAGGRDSVQHEHIVYAGPNLAFHICPLFNNSMLRHVFVPDNFRFGIIKPLLKRKHSDHINMEMYRGITLTRIISRFFESVFIEQ